MHSKIKVYGLSIMLVVFCFLGTPVWSQEPAIDEQTKDQLKVIMAHLLETIYVAPEIGNQLGKQLEAKFESGAYKEITDPTKLATALTRDLRELSKDLHLSVRYAPAAGDSESILTPKEWEQKKSAVFLRATAPKVGAAPADLDRPRLEPEVDAQTANRLMQSNYHFREAKYLSDKLGYLKLDGFAPGQAARDTAAKTMALLDKSEAMIIDLRRCPGGSQDMVNFLASYFFAKEPRLLLTSYFRPTGDTVESKTIADVPGKRLLDTELYLLVSANTGSACEAFSYILQQEGRAKVIGERTAGAGNHNFFVTLGKGFSFSVSIGSVIQPRTGKGWEGEGVQPDTAVKSADALEIAQKEALQKLISKTTDGHRKQELTAALQSLARSAASSAGSGTALQEYLGTYGNKEISLRDGGLYYQRIGGRGESLHPTGKDKFALSTDAQITFVRDATNLVTEMIIDWVDRDKEQLKREPPAVSASPAQPPASPTRSAPDDATFAKELDAYLQQAVAGDRFSGVVLVAKDGKPVFKKAYGMSDKSNNTPNNVDTKFDLGSMNKMFTAVAIAQLVERGKLSFTDTIGKLLPDYPNKTIADKVTVHQLLTHTSGMGSYFNGKFQASHDNLKTVADYLPLFVDEPLAFEPGAKWQYSNSAFVVLGLIIEKLSGQSYYDYVKEHIFKPAGMLNTDSYEKGQDVANLAIGYMQMGEGGRPDPSAPRRPNIPMRVLKGSPAGSGYSTVDDMLRFSLALQNHKLLSQKYTELVTTGKVEMGQPGRKYAYGFGEEISNGRRIIGHNGGGPGIGANFDVFTELGYTAVILGNYDPPAMMPVVMKIRELLPATPPSSAH